MNRRIRWFCIGLNGILIAAVFSLACFSEEAIPRDDIPVRICAGTLGSL